MAIRNNSRVFPRIRSCMWPGEQSPPRELGCDVWIVDHNSAVTLRCHCLESSPAGVRFLMPLGFTVRVGQLLELRASLPGERMLKDAAVLGNAWITIASIHILAGGDADEDRAEVCASRYPLERALNQSAMGERFWEQPADRIFAAGANRRPTNGNGTFTRP